MVLALLALAVGVRTQLTVASAVAVAIWCLIAVNITPTIPEPRTYFVAAIPAVLIIKCKDGEPCNVKKRMEKARARWAKQ